MQWRYMREWNYSSTILNLGTRWRWVINYTPRPLYLRGNFPRHLLDRRLCGPQNQSGGHGGEKSLAHAGNRTPNPLPPSQHPVPKPTDTDWTIPARYIIYMCVCACVYICCLLIQRSVYSVNWGKVNVAGTNPSYNWPDITEFSWYGCQAMRVLL
jgi:hypothetical protein